MPSSFRVVQADRLVQAGFMEPSVGLLRDATALVEQLFARLSRLGLHFREMRSETGDGSLGDTHLQCRLPQLRTLLRIHIHLIEVQTFDSIPSRGDALEQVVTEALLPLKAAVPNLALSSLTTSFQIHGELTGQLAPDFLAKFVKDAPALGPVRGAGATFYYGPHGQALWSNVTVDASSVIEGGLYLASRIAWDPEKVKPETYGLKPTEHVRTVIDQLGLSIGED